MGRYIDWYLVELEGLLKDHMPAAPAHDLLTEAEAHLTQSSTELRAKGMSEKDAELAAIERFGRVGQIASAATVAPHSRGKGSGLLVMALLTATLIVFVTMIASFSVGSWWASGWFVAALFVAFAVASMFARRPMWKAILVWSLPAWLCTAVVFGIAFCGTGFDERNLVPGLASSAQEVVGLVDGELRTLDERISWIKNPPQSWTSSQGSKRFQIPVYVRYGMKTQYFSAPAVYYRQTDDEQMAKSSLPAAATIRAVLEGDRRTFQTRAYDYQREIKSSELESAVTHLPAAAATVAVVSGAALLWQLFLVGLFALVGTSSSWYRKRYA